MVNALDLLACCLFSGRWSNAWILLACLLPGVQGSIGWTCLLPCAVLRAPSIAGLLPAGVRCTSLIFLSFSGDTPCFALHSKKYQNFPIVLGWKFKGNGQVSMGNSRETDISISPLGNYEKCFRFPKISPTKDVVKFHHFLQC